MKRGRGDGGVAAGCPKAKQQLLTMMGPNGGSRTSRGTRRRRLFRRGEKGRNHDGISDTLSLLDSMDTTLSEDAGWRVGTYRRENMWECRSLGR
jgi:hypothetical protein